MTSGRKGQTELIVILGLIVVAVVVIVLAVQRDIIPPPPLAGQELVKASIEDAIRSGANNVISVVSSHGGYLDAVDYQQGSVRLSDAEVPYWSFEGSSSMPDIKRNLETGLLNYLAFNKDALAGTFDHDVTFGDPRVSANILSNKVVFIVDMPTTVVIDDVPRVVGQPYEVSVPTRLGEIASFSSDYVQADGEHRFLEYFTLSTLSINQQEIPFGLTVLTECGETLYSSWSEVKPAVESSVKTTLAHVYMPGKTPTGVISVTGYPKYSLPEFNSRDYASLEVSFTLPDNFEFEPATLQMSPDPLALYTKPIPYTTICQSDAVVVAYYMEYPAIIRISDPLTGNVFQFADQVSIRDNLPAEVFGGYESDDQREICRRLDCPIDVTVNGKSGPLKDANVNFMGCSLGRTNSFGVYEGLAPCGIGPLRIDAPGYGAYEQMKSTSTEGVNEIGNVIVRLQAKPAVTLHFYEVIVELWGDKFRIPFGGINPIEDKVIRLDFMDPEARVLYPTITSEGGSVTMSQIPGDDYIVAGTLMDSQNTIGLGAFGTTYTLRENEDELHVYLPSYLGFNDISNYGDRIDIAGKLTKVLENCGVGPIRESSFLQTEMLVCEGS